MAETKSKKLVTHVGQEKSPVAMTFEDQVNALSLETPQKYIMQRQGRGGLTLDYVEANYVIGRLNATFQFDWDVEVMDKIIDTQGNQIAMWIRLTVRFANGKTVKKDAWGSAEIKRKRGDDSIIDLADDLKAAQSDGIKKAASMLNICWDVYSGYTKKANHVEPVPEPQPEPEDNLPDELDDISDLATNPEQDHTEKEKIVAEIKAKLEESAIGYKSFKDHLFKIQRKLKVPRNLVGKNFGNLSLTEGNLDDLRYLKKFLSDFMDNYTIEQAKEGDGEQPILNE